MYKQNISRMNDNDMVNLCHSSSFNDKIVYCGASGRFREIFAINHQNKCRVFNARNVRLTTAKQPQMYEVIGKYIEKIIVSHGGTAEPNNIDVILDKCPNMKSMVWVKLNSHATNNPFHFSMQNLHKLNGLQELHLILGAVEINYFTKICASVRKLQKIHIDVIDGVSNDALFQLANNSTQLAEVCIHLNNDLVDAEHLAELRALKKLQLVITEQYSKSLTPLFEALVDKHANRLEFLAIETTFFQHDDVLIIANLSRLKQLLICCEKFRGENNPDIDELCQLAIMPNLEALYLHNIRHKMCDSEMLHLLRAIKNINMLCVTPTADKFTTEFYKCANKILIDRTNSTKMTLTLGCDCGPMTKEEKAIVDKKVLKIVPSNEVRSSILGDKPNYE